MLKKKQEKAEKDEKKRKEKLRLLERKRLLLGKSNGSSKEEGMGQGGLGQGETVMPQFVATKRFLEEVKKAADVDLAARGVHLEALQAKEVSVSANIKEQMDTARRILEKWIPRQRWTDTSSHTHPDAPYNTPRPLMHLITHLITHLPYPLIIPIIHHTIRPLIRPLILPVIRHATPSQHPLIVFTINILPLIYPLSQHTPPRSKMLYQARIAEKRLSTLVDNYVPDTRYPPSPHALTHPSNAPCKSP